jgi:hypothetical protein
MLNFYSWVTLLAPTNISVMTPIIGDELDLGSPSFNQLFKDSNRKFSKREICLFCRVDILNIHSVNLRLEPHLQTHN